jgi:hypothetical protein
MRRAMVILGEVLVLALVYLTAGLTLGAIKLRIPSMTGMGLLLLVNIVVVAAASWYVVHTAASGWTVGAGVAAILVTMQLLLPRLEPALEVRTGLRLMARLTVVGGLAALVAALGLILVFGRPDIDPVDPPALWLHCTPLAFAWKIPVLVVVYGLLQCAAITLARSLRPPVVGGPGPMDVLLAQLACGAIWVGALAVGTLGLEGRLRPIAGAFVGFIVVAGLAGRFMASVGAPLDFWLPRTVLPGVADVLAGLMGVYLLVPPLVEEGLEAAPAGGPGAP